MTENKIEQKNENINNSSINNNLTVILANFNEYQEWQKELTLSIKTLNALPKNETELRPIYESKVSSLTENITNYEKQIKEAFSEIKVDLEYQQKAIDELGNLNFDEALKILQSKTIYIEDIETKIKIKSEELEKNKSDVANHYLLLALSTQTNYESPNWFEETCKYFKHSINTFSSQLNVFLFAQFLFKHNQFDEAIILFEKCLNDFQVLDAERATVLNELALAHEEINDFETALNEYQESLKISKDLAKKERLKYLPVVALILSNLAGLHRKTNKIELALTEIKNSLKIYRELANKESSMYLFDVATALNNLAIIHSEQNENKEAKKKYREALKILLKLPEIYISISMPLIATTLNNLACLNEEKGDLKKTLTLIETSLGIRRILAKVNPIVYSPDVALTLNNLGGLKAELGNINDALLAFEESEKIWKRCLEENSQILPFELAKTLSNLALFYQKHLFQKEKAVFYAMETFKILFPYLHVIPFIQIDFQRAINVLKEYELNEDEIEQLIALKKNENAEN